MADTPNSALELSDEEFLKQGYSLLAAAEAVSATTTTTDDNGGKGDQDDNNDQNQGDDSGQGTEPGAGASAQGDGEGDADPGANGGENKTTTTDDEDDQNTGDDTNADGKKRGPDGKFVKTDDATKDDKGDEGKKPEVTDDGKKPAPAQVNYQSEYERLLAPFKANGRDIKVENVDEAIRLMQMGANYNRKMAALKPNLAIMKTLENNGLLDPEKINFLIDLEKKSPEAISKLIKESGIDPLDISAEKADGYKPGNHSASETQVELDNVLDEIKDSPKYVETLDLVGKQWDAKSRKIVADQPHLLKVINGHMENGVFDLVATELERKKLFGGLQGLSDLEAYQQVGDAMAADGKFEHLTKKTGQSSKPGQQAPVVKTVVDPKLKKADDSKREEQRRAAAPAKTAPPTGKVPKDFNPLALSDEEFAKFKPTF